VAAATLFYAIAGVFTRRQLNRRAIVRAADGSLRPPTPLETALGSSLVAGVVATTLAVVLERPPDGLLAVPASGEGWLAVLWLGVLGTGLAYLLHFRILERWGPTRASLVTYVIPLVAVTLGFVVLGERPEPLELVGAALIIGGVVLVNSSVGQRPLLVRRARQSLVEPEQGP
jgi:drug/metabolite transporter (DMT)-like permease